MIMKKHKFIFITLIFIAVLLCILINIDRDKSVNNITELQISDNIKFFEVSKKPFNSLKASDIESVSVRLLPPDKTVSVKDFEELVSYLYDIEIYAQSDNDYTGQTIIFDIKMKDGTEINIQECSPIIKINDVSYLMKYEPNDELNIYANSLLNA